MTKNAAIVWFRNDLRLEDNEALTEACRVFDWIVPVYVFDPRTFKGKTSFGFDKTGPYRANFLLESVQDLQTRLRSFGHELVILEGKPEEVIANVAAELKTKAIYCNRERTDEEVKVQDALEKKLWSIGQEIRYHRGKMLYYTSDLPFPVAQTPDTFTAYRKEVERITQIRQPLPIPPELKDRVYKGLDGGELPTLESFGHQPVKSTSKFKGGESAAFEQLKYYFWETDNLARYKETRNEMLGWDFSSKFSPWLAAGCISPKTIFNEIKKYEFERVKNDSTYWLFFELLWRDYFRLMGKKHGNTIFQEGGTRGSDLSDKRWSTDRTIFNIWAEGRTGVPLVDANMKELNQTGFMSNRGRQIVASFLVNDLKVHWIIGAEYFESLLIDYDPCSNYGNWNYLAGVGSDPREDRYFNPLSQARKYDPQGEYIKNWLPELNRLSGFCSHKPWALSKEELSAHSITLGKEYPRPAVDTSNW